MDSKRMPVHSIERAIKTAGLFAKLGRNSSISMVKDLTRGRKPDFQKAVVSHRNVQDAVASLKNLRGAAMKFGQLVSLDETVVLSPELAAVLAQLRASGYAMPPKQLKAELTKNWGQGWLMRFAHFEVEPFAAASIGQVHRATLHSGEDVAVKIQFPNIKNTIESDLGLLRYFLRNSGLLPKGLDLDYYISACGEILKNETDYQKEAAHLKRFHAFFKHHDGIGVPRVFDEFTTDSILTTSFEEGQHIGDFSALSMRQRHSIAERLLGLILHEIFDLQLVQTDPNTANFLFFADHNQLTLLDFGACCDVTPGTYQIYFDLLNLALEGEAAPIKSYLLQRGLLPEALSQAGDTLIDDLLETLLSQLYASDDFNFAQMKVFDIAMEQDFDLYSALIPDGHVAADLMFIQRKLVGMVLYFKAMGISLPILPRLREKAAQLQEMPQKMSI